MTTTDRTKPSSSPWGNVTSGKIKSPQLSPGLTRFKVTPAEAESQHTYVFFGRSPTLLVADMDPIQFQSLKPKTQANPTLVSAAAVTKKTSLLILAFSLFSLAIFSVSGFVLFHPYFAILTAIASAIFYVMGVMIGRPARNTR